MKKKASGSAGARTREAAASRMREAETRVIPRGEWESFLDQFTEFNMETTVRLEVMGAPETGSQVICEERPLLAITLDDEAGTPQLIIECGDTVGGTPASLRHVVADPTALRALKKEELGYCALEIESLDENRTILTVNPHPGRQHISFKETGRSETRVR